MIEKLKTPKTLENDYIRKIAKSMAINAQSLTDPRLLEEEKLLMTISDITDNKTMLEVKNRYHNQYNVYDFDAYLCFLRKLCELLLSGAPKNFAYDLIDADILMIYHDIIPFKTRESLTLHTEIDQKTSKFGWF